MSKHEANLFKRFCAVGGIGFLVDAGLLTVLTSIFGFGSLTARAISVPVAVLVTYALNRYWAFASLKAPPFLRGLLAYAHVQALSLAVNLAVYTAGIKLLPRPFDHPTLSLVIASATAMALTYAGTRRFVFPHRAVASGTKLVWDSPAEPLAPSASVFASIALAALIILVPALINGYPFIFSDTGTYLLSPLKLQIPWDRPVFYGIFAILTNWTISPWPTIFVQAAIVASLILILSQSLFGLKSPWTLVGICTLLTAATSLPWFAGELLPDVFSSILILALLLIVLAWEKLVIWEKWFTIALVPLCISVHNANLLIVLAAVPATAALYVFGWHPLSEGLRRVVLVAGGTTLALLALIGSNVAARGQFVVSGASNTFLFAKLLEDNGPAMAVLDSACPEGYRLCSQLARLKAHDRSASTVSTADYFLWSGPLAELGWWKPVEPEAADVVRKALASHWPDYIMRTIRNGIQQFTLWRIGDALESDILERAREALTIFGTTSAAHYETSLQNQKRLPLDILNSIQLTLLIASWIVMGLTAVILRNADRKLLYAAIFIFVMLAAHALAIAALTPLHDRYQSRVIWIVPMFAVLALTSAPRRFRWRASAPSITPEPGSG